MRLRRQIGTVLIVFLVFSACCDISNTAGAAPGIGWSSMLSQHVKALEMVTPTDGWALCEPTKKFINVFTTDDGGHTWVNVSPAQLVKDSSHLTFEKGFKTDFVDSWTGYIAVTDKYVVDPVFHGYMEQTAVLYTNDGGSTWHMTVIRDKKENQIPLAMGFESAQTGWIITITDNNGGEGPPIVRRMYKTTNGGVTWKYVGSVK